MPTITIHVPDDHVGDIVATLMQWDDLTITIDQRDAYITRSWDEIAARDVAARAATKPTAGASTEEIKAYVAARAATEEPHPLVVTIGEQERQRIYDTRLVLCPKCKARAGIPCQSPSGGGYGNTFVHNARRVAYNQARRITLDEV